MKSLIFLPLLLVLGACGADHVNSASAEPVVVGVPVAVAVTQPCVPDTLLPPPDYVDTKDALTAALDAAERYQLLFAGRAQRIKRLNEVEPVVAACPKGRSTK